MPLFRNDRTDRSLTRHINYLLDNYKIISINQSTYHCFITFEDSIVVDGWNANKYYAWFSQGNIKKDGEVIFNWDNGMPSRKCSRRVRKVIDEFINCKILKN